YADFDLKTAAQKFGLTRDESRDLFGNVEPIPPSDTFRGWLAEFAPVATGIGTEQARRDFIITPILADAKRRSWVALHVFPGALLDGDLARGRTGMCDYLIARSTEIYYCESPDRLGRRGEARGHLLGARPVRSRDGRDPDIQ